MSYTYTGYTIANNFLERKKQHATDMIFDLLTDEFIFVEKNAEILCLDIMILLHRNYDNELLPIIEENPNAVILIHSVICHHDFLNHLGAHVGIKPSYLNNREFYFIHFTNIEKTVPWASEKQYLYWDVRFDHYRFYTIMGKQNSPWEHRSVLYTKPNIKKTYRDKIFLIPNRYVPQEHKFHPRNQLFDLCLKQHISDVSFFSNQPHSSSFTLNDNSFKTFNEKYEDSDGIRLIGALEDPTINNYTIWNPITNTIEPYSTDLMPIDLEKHYVNNKIHTWYYQNTYCSIYVESAFNNDTLPSEKTWAPLSQGHFILPLAGKGIIRLIQKMGFKVPVFIDYSYDDIEDTEKRIRAWLNEIDRLAGLGLTHFRHRYENNQKLLQYNTDLFYKLPVQNPIKHILSKG